MASNPHRGGAGGSLYGGADPYRSREGLSTRNASGSEEVQLRIDPMHSDLDDEIIGLHGQVRQLKNIAQEIGSEAKSQRDFLDELQEMVSHGIRLGHQSAKKSIGFIEAITLIAKEEGVKGYWKGNLPQQMTLIRAQAGVKNNIRKLNLSIIRSGNNHIMHVVLFALLLFFILYMWSKMFKR